MTPAEMAKTCHESIAAMREFGLPEDRAQINLVTPPKWKVPPKFPRGYLLQVKDDGRRIWHFPAVRVLAWLQSNKLEEA